MTIIKVYVCVTEGSVHGKSDFRRIRHAGRLPRGGRRQSGRTVYDRCTVVALCSAKAQNPACTVALLTNAPVPEPFRSQLTQGGVEIWDCPFTTYRVPADTNWALAYYKLCAMRGCWKTATLPAR